MKRSIIHYLKNSNIIRVILIKSIFQLNRILFLPFGILIALSFRILHPFIIIRVGVLVSQRLGHYAGNTEMYLCEKDVGINMPSQGKYIDIWCDNWPVCNEQLKKMWGRVLHIWPSWIWSAVVQANTLLPYKDRHLIPANKSEDRDVHNLLDKSKPHLYFSENEKRKAHLLLEKFGVPEGAKFICLNVRDESYLQNNLPWHDWSYHDYRNCNVQNYSLAALELVKRGYYVVRMGALVKEEFNISHPMVIDYATNGMRNDFMDIYLGANCTFCISNGTGFDSVPYIFRRPIVFVDHVPLGLISTFSDKFLATTKKIWLRKESRFMTFNEIFDSGAGYGLSSREDGLGLGIDLIESTPNEILAVVLEMEERLRGIWVEKEGDKEIQQRFWDIFHKNKEFHGELKSRIGADFLRQNKYLLV